MGDGELVEAAVGVGVTRSVELDDVTPEPVPVVMGAVVLEAARAAAVLAKIARLHAKEGLTTGEEQGEHGEAGEHLDG